MASSASPRSGCAAAGRRPRRRARHDRSPRRSRRQPLLRRREGEPGRQLLGGTRDRDGADRAERRRQDHAVQLHHRLLPALERRDPLRRRADQRLSAGQGLQAGDGADLAEGEAAGEAHRARQHRGRCALPDQLGQGGAGDRDRAAPRRPPREPRGSAGRRPAHRRAEEARAGAGPRHAAAHDPAGRGDGRPQRARERGDHPAHPRREEARPHAGGDRARHEGDRADLRSDRGAQLGREARRGVAAGDRERPARDDRLPRRQRRSQGMSAWLEVRDLDFAYGDVQVLRGVSLTLNKGEIVTLVGSNGAGKSTTLRNISRLLRPRSGTLVFDGHDLTRLSSHQVVELGVIHVPEGRRVFPEMTILENLRMGSYIRSARADRAKNLERGLTLFPRLKERIGQLAGTLSGGEQQMLAIARGLMAKPRLLILDEPSLGLSPLLVRTIFDTIAQINAQGTSVLLVEQNVYQSLRIAARGYVLETGRIALSGTGTELLANDQVKAAFLGA